MCSVEVREQQLQEPWLRFAEKFGPGYVARWERLRSMGVDEVLAQSTKIKSPNVLIAHWAPLGSGSLDEVFADLVDVQGASPKPLDWSTAAEQEVDPLFWMLSAGLPFRDEDVEALSLEDCLIHSIIKWEQSLAIAHLKVKGSPRFRFRLPLSGNERFVSFGGHNCALCVKLRPDHHSAPECRKCPLNEFSFGCSSMDMAPYGVFTLHDDPRPMLAALYTALAVEKNRRKKNG